jgi:NAD(P)H-dependent flavin oxidoreductase YrpB (nitropropane dioxygenase family)
VQVWTAGQVIGLIHDIPTCAELVSRIEREAAETMRERMSLIEDPKPVEDPQPKL